MLVVTNMPNNQQPDPSPPEFRPAQPPSWLTYVFLAAISTALISVAFSLGAPDWSGLLINLASGILTAILLLIIIDRRFRTNEFSALQVRTSTFTTQVASVFSPNIADTVGYAKVLANQLGKIRPSYYVERPALENLLDKHPGGFLVHGVAGIGKTTLVQTIALKYAKNLAVNPKGKLIPVLIPVRNWRIGNIVEQIYKEIDKFYPVRTKVLRDWLRNKPMLLIFDGLDEHSNPETVMMEIETLRKLASNFVVIATSRTMRLPNNSQLTQVNLMGFTVEESKRQIDLIGSSPESLARVIHQISQGNPLIGALAAQLAKRDDTSPKSS
jgi:hypothetical protein